MEGVVHPAAVTDAILRWASDAGWESSPNARHPAATALLLRSACALARVAPNDDVLQRQLRHAQALLQVVRDSAGLDSRGGPAHWGAPFAWPPQSGPDAGAGLGSDYIWNKGNKLFVSEPKPHGGTTEVTAVVGHALLDAYELIVSGVPALGEYAASTRSLLEGACEWLLEECVQDGKAPGLHFRCAPMMLHEAPHATAAAIGFLSRAASAVGVGAITMPPSWESALGLQAAAATAAAAATPSARRAWSSTCVVVSLSASRLEALASAHRASGSPDIERALVETLGMLQTALGCSTEGRPRPAPEDAPDDEITDYQEARWADAGLGACALAVGSLVKAYNQLDVGGHGEAALADAKRVAAWLVRTMRRVQAAPTNDVATKNGERGLQKSMDGAGAQRAGEEQEQFALFYPPAVQQKRQQQGQQHLSMEEQATAAYAFSLLAALHTDSNSAAANGGSLSTLIAGVWQPGVSPVTHTLVQVTLGCLFVLLVGMIHGGYAAGGHMHIMLVLNVGLIISYGWFLIFGGWAISVNPQMEAETVAESETTEKEDDGKKSK